MGDAMSRIASVRTDSRAQRDPVNDTGDRIVDIEKAITQILVNEVFVSVPQSQIKVDDGLLDILGLDSLGFIELRTQCEDVFGVRISDDDFRPENFASVRTVAQLVSRLRESLPDGARTQ